MTNFLTAATHLTDSLLFRWLLLLALICGVTYCLALSLGRAASNEPPQMQTDAEADREWDDICAALGLDRQQIRTAYTDNACAELRRGMDAWETRP